MHLTTAPAPVLKTISRRRRVWAFATITAAIGGIFTLDYFITVDAPFQHLYYLPIIMAARVFGRTGGLVSAAGAVVLYHLAKRPWLGFSYGESDLIQVALFFAVGLITAKMAGDARRMQQLAMTDDLTGLHNLRSFEATLEALITAGRQDGSAISLLVLDVDRLKTLNDGHGHLAGADAVRTVGHILAKSLPSNAVACRYGGDEFVIALPRYDPCHAEQIGNDLCANVHAASPVLAGYEWPVGTLSISIGVASAVLIPERTNSNDGERLFHAADQALYRAKGAGRNRLCSVYIGEM